MATRSNPPTLTLVDARRRVEGHWAALTLACRAVDEAQILEQIAAFQTLVDAGCLNVLDPADPMAVLALCHQLRRLRSQLVQHTARVKRASGTIALGGGSVHPSRCSQAFPGVSSGSASAWSFCCSRSSRTPIPMGSKSASRRWTA